MRTTARNEPAATDDRLAATHHFPSADGTPLFYRAWLPSQPARRAVVLIHRGHEHSGRWEEVVKLLDLPDTACFAWDARGHGQSPGERGYAENLGVYVKDLDCFVRFLAREYCLPIENMVLIAHSVGAVITAAWVHDYAPSIRAMVLATPAFRVKLYVPLAVPGLRLLNAIKPKAFIRSYVGGRLLTHDAAEARRYDEDPQISRAIAVNILLDLYDTSTRLIADAAAIRTPTLLLAAGADKVVAMRAQQEFFARLSSPAKSMEVLEGSYHAIFHETLRREVIQRVRQFLLQAFAAEPPAVSHLAADQAGYTRSEYDELSRPLPLWSWRRLCFAVQRVAMQTLGRLSQGIRIGWSAGFDSGESLDYVYRNRAQGFSPLARWIDRAYLDSVGWRGIRQRKLDLQQALKDAVAQAARRRLPLQVVDIASGPGRYLLETLQRLAPLEIEACLRDRSAAALECGRRLASELGLTNVRFERGDAFNRAELAGLSPRPSIAIVSGLYELFPDNHLVLESLRGLAEALPPGGTLIYTNQPWHPQLEMIARVLPNRDGKPWIMRRRTQAEMDGLARAAGFEKIDMRIDPSGIFTVSTAQRL